MKILSLDTSTEACSVALLAGDRNDANAWHRRYLEAPRGHGEWILPMIDAVLGEGGLRLRDLDAIAFGRGPGSFTGVRLAASVVQGLAFGAGVPVVPVSTLAALALRARRASAAAAASATAAASASVIATAAAVQVLVCNDARMDEVYVGAYDAAGGALVAERVLAPAAVRLPGSAAAAATEATRWVGAGRGFKAYPVLRECLPHGEIFDDLLPRAEEVLALALDEVAAGRVWPATAALPIYVRDEVAVVPVAPKTVGAHDR